MRRRSHHWIAVSAALIASAGCASLLGLGGGGPAPPVKHYLLHAAEAPPAASRPLPRRLVIGAFSAVEPYRTDRLVYRESPLTLGYYEEHRFALPPDALVRRFLRERIEARRLFASVVDEERERPAGGDLVLEGTVLALEEVAGEDVWSAAVDIELAVREVRADPADGSGGGLVEPGPPIVRHRIRKTRAAREKTPLAFVEAASLAIDEGIDELATLVADKVAPHSGAP
jgi:uncharacterized lipoprotein YmbA